MHLPYTSSEKFEREKGDGYREKKLRIAKGRRET